MIALVVTVPVSELELASDALWSLGVVAIEERAPAPGRGDGGAGPGDVVEPLELVELWTSLGDDVDEISSAVQAFPEPWRWALVEVDESIADSWREHAMPTSIDTDLVVCPAWVDDATAEIDPAVTVIRIEPGSTFGLGDHPTTVLSMRALRRSMFVGATMLDVGCGSGVLAVAAAVFGAARVDAIDISPASLQTTTDNAERNGVSGQITVSTRPLADVVARREAHEGYDVVVANILAPTLIELSADLQRATKRSGVLIISGVLVDRHAHVEAALAPMRCVERDVLGGWAALTLEW